VPQHAASTAQDASVWIDFAAAGEADRWFSVNDNVMGGVSSGQLDADTQSGVFHGITSLQNNGGFASVRRHLASAELAGCRALAVLVKGDGREYQLRLRQQRSRSAIAWRHCFTASNDWQTMILPLADFAAVFRGRPVPDAGAVDAASVCDIGIMIADGQAGPFRLQLEHIQRR